MELCISCKGCKRECPTGVDMARMKIEFLHQWRKRHVPSLREEVVGYLPRYAPLAARLARDCSICATACRAWRSLSEKLLGFSARRKLPRWHKQPYRIATPSLTLPLEGEGMGGGRK